MEEARKLEEGTLATHAKEQKQRDSAITTHPGGDDHRQVADKIDGGDAIKNHDQDEQPVAKPRSKRIATLDAFRGLTIVVFVIF